MNVVCINGSPRNNGSSAFLIHKVLEGISCENINSKIYCLGDMKINYCAGCKKCYQTGHCFQKDDVNTIIDDIIKSDLIFIASPSYWGDVTGQLKVFFDRNTPYCDTNSNVNRVKIPDGKKGISIAVMAGQSDRENIHILETIEHYYGHLGIKPIGRFSLNGVDTIDDLLKKKTEINSAIEFGKRMVQVISNAKEVGI